MQRFQSVRRRWRDPTVFAVAPSGKGSWEVLQEPVEEPIASFTRKEQALGYAFAVARTRANWQIFLRSDTMAPGALGERGIPVASGENVPWPAVEAGPE